METEILKSNHWSSTGKRVIGAVGPVLWISISYIGPGWAAAAEGGSRFGFDLAFLVLLINFNAILCHYLSGLIPIATGRNLSQVCRQEYNDMTCVVLGIHAEISMIVLDLTMVLGTAYGLNAVFGIDLFNCVFLTGLDAVLFPIFNSLLETPKAKTSICLACFILASYASGTLISQPESSLSVSGIFNKLNGENAYSLMGILGANIMPHNFYLHSSIVQQDQGQTNVSKGALSRDLFFATFFIFSGIFLVNFMVMNLAANVFYSSGLTLLTLQDALSLLDQGYRTSLASVPLIFIIIFSNQLVAVTWCLDKEVITHDFFGLEIPAWLHRATIRIFAIIPALSCVWNSGAEGIFELLIFAQVLVALLLPPSVIPLFRVASTVSIMGTYKISNLVEFFALVSFVGMLGLNIIFVIELVFGSSDWVIGLKWNTVSSLPISYLVLLIAVFSSLPLMVSLAITPLKSASSGVDTQALKWNKKDAVTESPIEGRPTKINKAQYHLEDCVEKQEPASSSDKSLGNEGNHKACAVVAEMFLSESSNNTNTKSQDHNTLSTESKDIVDRTSNVEGGVQMEKDAKGNPWEPEELATDVFESIHSLGSEGPQSCRSVSGKSDDVGSGAGSKSRLAGLGCAARHHLTAILDEFWGLLFDFNGHVTQEAKGRKLDTLLEIDTTAGPDSASIQVESVSKESSGCFPAANARGSDLLRASTVYNGSMQHIGQGNTGASPGTRLGSSVKSTYRHLLDSHVRNSSLSTLDSSERRYSVHVPSSSDGRDRQPATVHGYDMALYLGRGAKGKAFEYHKGRLVSLTLASGTSVNSKSIDSHARLLGQKPPNGLRSLKSPGFHNVPVSRNGSLKSKLSFRDSCSPKSVIYSNHQHNVKKFLSLPDVSGLHSRHRSFVSNINSQWDNSVGYGQSISRPVLGKMRSNSSWAGTASQINKLYPSKISRVPFSLQFSSGSGFGSLWSKQPCEQFGVADNTPKTQETASNVDMEAKLLQSFRCCIVKLVRLEGSEWLFRQNDGAGEDLIDCLAARERFFHKIESMTVERNLGSAARIDEINHSYFMSVPNCGDECVWRVDIIISFGVWCIHRILELSLVENRTELWGKYTNVLSRLQGVIGLAFLKPRSPTGPCFCLQLPSWYHQKSGSSSLSSSLPPPPILGRGKFSPPAMLLDMIRDVEIAISCRKSPSSTAAGDMAFPEGKENLASILQRYKQRLSSKSGTSQEVEHRPQNVAVLSSGEGL